MSRPTSGKGDGPHSSRDELKQPSLPVSAATYSTTQMLKNNAVWFATPLSSIAGVLAAYPFDTVKSRMQTYDRTGILGCARKVYAEGGFRLFYKGAALPTATITLVRTVSMSIYQKTKIQYSDLIDRQYGMNPVKLLATPGTTPSLSTISCIAISGATAGSFITVFACPFELSKLSSQTSGLMAEKFTRSSVSDPTGSSSVVSSYKGKGSFGTMKAIYVNHGLRGLYTGFKLHLLRDTLGTALYFTTYESTTQLYRKYTGLSTGAPALAGGICGVVGWALVYPIDSAKARYQMDRLAQARGSVRAPKIQFFKPDMYRGFTVNAARSGISNAMFFSAYEFLSRHIKGLKDE